MPRLAQLATDIALWASKRGRSGLGFRLGANALRRALIKAGDPLIRYEIGGFPLRIPLSHELPYYRAECPEYGANLARLASAVASKYPHASAIDIGANVGDTAALIRSVSDVPVLCIEGDERFFRILTQNAAHIPGLSLEKTLVGRSSETIEARLATAKGSGHVVTEAGSSLRLEPLGTILARWPSLPPPRLVKIDTDGFDCDIVEGATDVWKTLNPILFFEYDPAYQPITFEPSSFFGRLEDTGYDRVLVYENTGDFLVSVRLRDAAILEDLHHFFSGRAHARYADIVAFPADERDLAESFRRSELEHFAATRSGR